MNEKVTESKKVLRQYNTCNFDTFNYLLLGNTKKYIIRSNILHCLLWVMRKNRNYFSFIEKTYFFREYSLKSWKQTAQKWCPQSAFCIGSFKARWQIRHIDSVGNSSTKPKSCMLTGSNSETIFQQNSWRDICSFTTIFLETIYSKTLILARIIWKYIIIIQSQNTNQRNNLSCILIEHYLSWKYLPSNKNKNLKVVSEKFVSTEKFCFKDSLQEQ